jgi:hypothetical protein
MKHTDDGLVAITRDVVVVVVVVVMAHMTDR